MNAAQTLLSQALAAHRAGHLADAAELYRVLLVQAPDTAPALTNLGSILRQQGQWAEAIDLLQRAIVAPGSNEHAAYNLGNACRSAGRHAEALAAFRLAVERKPNWALAHCNLGVIHADLGELDAAETALRQALALEPGLGLARDNLAALLSRRIMALQYQPLADEKGLRSLAEEYGALCPAQETVPIRPRSSDEPLRVGFVSPDLCDHPVGLFLLPVLKHLDRQRIHPMLYSTGGREDDTRRALREQVEWFDMATLDDTALLASLRCAALDVLVDLSGHTKGHCLPVFARRAATLQVSWLGYFASTGLPAIDYVLMDAWHAPDGAEDQFTEPVIRLPFGRFCFQAVPFAPEVSSPPCLSQDYVTFGSFNNTAKYHEGVFDRWATILRAIPESRLILKWRTFDAPGEQQRLQDNFAQRGVDPARIEWRPFSFHADLLKEYADIDIALDPFPFTGGHTSCESLWMGVPVVTWPQNRAVSRQTFAFLSAIGLPELAAQDADDYVRIAIELAQNRERLQQLRQTLRERMQTSPLCDAVGFTRTLENTLIELHADIRAKPWRDAR